MACDLQFTVSGIMKLKGKTKIYLVEPHERHYAEQFIIGFAGGASCFLEVIDYFEYPDSYAKCPTPKGLQGLVVTASGKIFQFDNPSKWIPVAAKAAAIGSGSPAAYGALHSGASPLEAVKAASKVDVYTGMGTRVIRFK